MRDIKKILPFHQSSEFPGSELEADDIEFAQAMELYQRKYRRRYPSWREVLFVVHHLGYRKVDDAMELPELPNPHTENRS